MNTKVTHYEGTVYYVSTGSSHTGIYPFTETHAVEANTILDEEGIPMEAAQKLCEHWTNRGKYTSIRYSYRLSLNQPWNKEE